MTDKQYSDSLQERAQQLPRALQPSSPLWSRVEAEIADAATPSIEMASPGLRASRQLWPIAALTILGVALVTLVLQSTPVQPDLVLEPDTSLEDTRKIPVKAQTRTEMQAQMHQLLDAQLGDLPSDVRTTVIENLEIIATAREEIRQALDQNPNSTLLHSLYLKSYANERTLLKDVEAMARQTKRRTYL